MEAQDGQTWVGKTAETFLPPVNIAGTYYYRVIATMSAAGCSYAVSPSYSFVVVNPATVSVTPASTSLCIGGSQVLTANITGASGTYSIVWQESNNNAAWWNVTTTSSATFNTINDSLELAYFRPVIDFSACGLYYGSSVQVQTNPIHTVDAVITNAIVCVGGATILNGIVAGTTGTVTYQWQFRTSNFAAWANVPTGGTGINYTPPTTSPGLIYYRLNVTTTGASCGTISSPSVTLNIVAQASVTIAPSNTVICRNGNYTLNSSVINGVGPFTYQWQRYNTSNSTWENMSGQTASQLPIPTATVGFTDYRVIVNSSGNGCNPATSALFNVEVRALPTLTASNTSNSGLPNPSANTCVGTLVVLKGNYTGALAVTNYSWSHASGYSSTQQNPAALMSNAGSGGIYTVTGLATNGCSNTMTTNVIVNTNCAGNCGTIIDVRPLNPSGCTNTNGNITVDEFGGNNYETSLDGITWNRGYFVYSNLGVGSYLVFLRDWTSKIICRTVNITLEAKLTSFYTGENVTNATSCFNANGSIQLLGVQNTDQVSWIVNSTRTYTSVASLTPSQTISGLKPGTYAVRVARGGVFCYSERDVLVGNSGIPCPVTTICSVSATAPNLFPNGDFGSGASTTGPVLPTDVTTYGYTLPSCNAPNDGFYTIVNTTDCNGASAGGNIFGTWLISDDHTIGDIGGYMMVVNASHNPDIVVQKTITNLCPNTQYNFTAYVKNLINPAFYSTHIYPNLNFMIDGVIQYTTGNITNQNWNLVGFSFKTGSTTTEAIFSIRNKAPGGTGNDWIIDDVVVNKCPLDILLDGESVACLGGTNETINATITDPNREHDFYKWQESNDDGATWQDVTGVLQGTFVGNDMNVTINLPTPIVSALSGKLYRIRLATTAATVGDPICSVVSQISKVIVPPVVVNVTPPVTICNGTSTSLTAVGSGGTSPYTYTWTNTAATGGTVSVSPTTTTNYTVTARDVDNCSATATTQVIVTPLPTINVTPATVCSGVSANVTVIPVAGISYSWRATTVNGGITGATTVGSGTGATINDVLVNPGTANATVTYTITASTSTTPACTSTATVLITVRPNIVITPPANPTICSGTAFTVTPVSNITTPAPGTTYSWSASLLSGTPGSVTTITSNSSTTNVSISDTLSNSAAVNGVVRYVVTPYANGCGGAPFNVDVTVRPNLTVNPITLPAICSGGNPAAVTPTVNNTIGGTNTFTWTLQGALPAGVTMTPTTGTGTSVDLPTITNVSAVSVTLTFNLTGTNSTNNCPINVTTFTITVFPRIDLNPVTIPAICSGGDPSAVTPTFVNSVSGTNSFTWTLQGTLPAGVTMSATTGTGANVDLPVINNTTNANVTLTFNLTGTNSANNCPINCNYVYGYDLPEN